MGWVRGTWVHVVWIQNVKIQVHVAGCTNLMIGIGNPALVFVACLTAVPALACRP